MFIQEFDGSSSFVTLQKSFPRLEFMRVSRKATNTVPPVWELQESLVPPTPGYSDRGEFRKERGDVGHRGAKPESIGKKYVTKPPVVLIEERKIQLSVQQPHRQSNIRA